MKIIRFVLGKLILFLDSVTSPKPMTRTADQQIQVNQAIQSLVIYQMHTCPFCIKVRRKMKELAIDIPLKNVDEDKKFLEELMAGGKIDQVPCLRKTESNGAVTWLYESSDINDYLQKAFG